VQDIGENEMVTETFKFDIQTVPDEIVNITPNVERCVQKSNIKDGTVTIFMPGSTGGISFLEFEPGLVKIDVPTMLQQLFPAGPDYQHHQTWGDHNGHSHLRSFFVPPSQTVPIINGELILGTWQQIVFCEFDEKARKRTIYCQLVG